MKRIALATVAVVMFFASLASAVFAAAPVAEPPLPADIGTYQPPKQVMCMKHEHDTLVQIMYQKRVARDLVQRILVTSWNDQKIDQQEFTAASQTRYVKNSRGGNWLRYSKAEWPEATAGFLAEIGGLQAGQMRPCDK